MDEEVPDENLHKELDLQFCDNNVIKKISYEDALDIIGKYCMYIVNSNKILNFNVCIIKDNLYNKVPSSIFK